MSGPPSYEGVRALVLGASGFLGRWVARALEASGARTALVVRSLEVAGPILSRYSLQGDVFEADLLDEAAVRKLFREIQPSITFNLAGYGVDRSERDEKTAYRVNASLLDTVCEAIAEVRDSEWTGPDIVHAGSALEYGAARGDLREETPPRPTTLYGRSKLEGTRRLARRCAEGRLRGVTARLFTVYGPGEHPGRLLPSLLEAAATGKPLPLTAGGQRRDFTYVEEVAEGMLRLGRSAVRAGEIVNLATGRLHSVREFVLTAAGVLGIPAGRLLFAELPTRAEEMEHDPVAIARLRDRTGWAPAVDLEEGIRRTRDLERAAREERA